MIKQSQLSISHLCSNETISRASFYRLQKEQICNKTEKDLKKRIYKIALEFPFYGYRRITKKLQINGFNVNHKKVLKVMKENNIICRRKNRFKPVTTQSNHSYGVYPNLVKDLIITGLNQLWVADITYVHLPNDFAYLAVIIDIFSRKCIGWNLSKDINTVLALGALNKAIATRNPLGISKLIHHSDQGMQYASDDYVNRLKEFGIEISMSRKGNPYDNAFAESFMKTLKVEEVYINDYENFEDALKNIKHFIEKVYNAKRLHSGIGYLSPDKFEQEVLNIN